MPSEEIRRRFLEFFRIRGHAILPSSSLIPDDPSVLLTTAGMQQFKPYFLGKADSIKDFGSINTASIQKCFRTSDIDEVGDEKHLTFFEMLGHFSFGDYFKKKTIAWTYELLTKEFSVEENRITATVFEGDAKVPFDQESFDAWTKLLSVSQVKKGSRGDNFWGPAGAEGPCGAANEVYVDDVEVATLVFIEYNCAPDGTLTPLSKKGVDVGWGFERLAMIVQIKPNIFETDLFSPLISFLPVSSSVKIKRILADHIRAAAFLISDGVRPGNKEAGYVLRRLIRRIVFHEKEVDEINGLFEKVVQEYGKFYPELEAETIIKEFSLERERFLKTLSLGIKELDRLKKIDAGSAFRLYESFGLPYEVIKEVALEKARGLERKDFDEEFKKHQEISRAGAEKKFGGHGLILNTGELKAGDEAELKKVTRLHTATHLLQWALREVLGKDVRQAGSDITPERTRFDFTFSRKLTQEETKKVEELVNQKIGEDLPVNFKEMPKDEAEKTGALYFFKEKYPDKVKVYYIGKSLENAISKEFCGGPHVDRTGEIEKFRIFKEEAVGAGVRRIRGVTD